MLNYKKHTKLWDKYEQNIENHFERKDIIKYGSKDKQEKIL